LLLVRQIEDDAARVDSGGAPSRLLRAAAAVGSRTDSSEASPAGLATRARRTAYRRLTPLAIAAFGSRSGPLGAGRRPPADDERHPTDHALLTSAVPTERTDRADS
jgi:hypothetical protein